MKKTTSLMQMNLPTGRMSTLPTPSESNCQNGMWQCAEWAVGLCHKVCMREAISSQQVLGALVEVEQTVDRHGLRRSGTLSTASTLIDVCLSPSPACRPH